jgi:hypothetical protein
MWVSTTQMLVAAVSPPHEAILLNELNDVGCCSVSTSWSPERHVATPESLSWPLLAAAVVVAPPQAEAGVLGRATTAGRPPRPKHPDDAAVCW